MEKTTPARTNRVLHIITGLENGGAEGALFRLVTHDKERTHSIISLRGPGKYGPILEAYGVEVSCLHLSAKTMPKALGKLVAKIRAANADVVQTWLYHADVIGGTAARVAGAKRIIWGIRGAAIDEDRAKRSTMRMVRTAAFLSRSIPEAVISCSERAARDHVAMGYPEHLMHCVSNGYDLEQMQPDEAGRARLRETFGVPNDTFLVGMAARFDPQKDHANLFEAFSLSLKDRDARLVLAGSGCDPENEALAQLAEAAGVKDQVIFAGQQADMPAFYSALDLHALSSAYGEGFPNVIAEAMACGTPAVGTDVGETGLVLGESGTLVPPRAPEALALALADAERVWREDRDSFEAVAAAGRQHITDNFSIATMISGFARVWG